MLAGARLLGLQHFLIGYQAKFKMAASMVHVDQENSSDSDEIQDDFDGDNDESTEDIDDDVVSDHSDEEKSASKSGLGNVMSKILRKQSDSSKAILSKGLTDRQILKRCKMKEEGDGQKVKKVKQDSGDEDSESGSSDEEDNKGGMKYDPLRVKPDPLLKDHERLLQRIATRGVVQLFNAVQKQQKTIDEKMKLAGASEVKKDRLMKTVTKGGFMDMLKHSDKLLKSEKTNVDNEPSWKILRDDFMMGAKMKDWDKESDDGGGSDGIE